jgi:hypothetical protein
MTRRQSLTGKRAWLLDHGTMIIARAGEHREDVPTVVIDWSFIEGTKIERGEPNGTLPGFVPDCTRSKP